MALAALTLSAGVQTTAAKKKAAAKTAVTHKKSSSTKSTAHKTGSSGHSASTASRGKATASRGHATASRTRGKTTTAHTTWRNRQMQPTPERYKEIQQALANKGYLRPDDVNGAWGQSSTDALKKFQADQSIDGGGKLNSLSLIALGLGPKHDTAAVPKPADVHAQQIQ